MSIQLIVRGIDEELVTALERVAAAHKRSVEAEHREILKAALATPTPSTFKEVLENMPNLGEDSDFLYR